jgi:hypothetical protein
VSHEAGKGEYRPATSSWSEAWTGLDLENTVTPLKLAALLPVVHGDTIRALIAGDDGAWRIMSEEYKAERIVVASAEVDGAAKRLNVLIAGEDAAGPISWKRSYRLQGGDVSYAMELAAVVTLGVLEGRWKATKAAARGGAEAFSGPGTEIRFLAEFSSLAEWNELRHQILETPGVDDVQIGAVSARSAEVFLRYPGGGETLASAWAGQGLSLRNESGQWLLRAGAAHFQ